MKNINSPICYTVVVTYNGERWIEACLSSLLKSSYPTKIVVVDNGSVDNTMTLIRKFPKVHIIEAGENLGFGKANNLGLVYAMEQGADYCFLINQDAFVAPETLNNLINKLQENHEFGLLSPIHLDEDGSQLDHGFRKYMKSRSSSGFYQDFKSRSFNKKIYEVGFVNAAAWLLSASCVKKVGLFHPLFFHYGEDVNYVQRVRYHGFKIGIDPEAEVNHCRTGRISPIYADRDQAFRRRALNEIMNPNIKSSIIKYLRALSHAFDIVIRSRSKDFPFFLYKANKLYFELKKEAVNFDDSKLYEF